MSWPAVPVTDIFVDVDEKGSADVACSPQQNAP
jgi:hypothetical protein